MKKEEEKEHRKSGLRRGFSKGVEGIIGFWGKTQVCRVVGITAIQRVVRLIVHARSVRRKGSVAQSSPSPHGGRGALPSEGGSPSDLLFLAGGGKSPLVAVPFLFASLPNEE